LGAKHKDVKCDYTTFNPTKLGVQTLIKAIKLAKVDIYKPYNLYNITYRLQELVPYTSKRDFLRLNYTKEIQMTIEYIKKNKLV
jgi:hypothetical protein